MSMKSMYDLRDMLCEELEKIAKKSEMSAGDLEAAHKLTDTIKNIDKISMLEESGYSETSGRGNSYANRGEHYVRGHYSRDGYSRNSSRSGRSGNYSRSAGNSRIVERLEYMLDDADSEKEREAIQRCINQLENA